MMWESITAVTLFENCNTHKNLINHIF